MTFSRTTQWTLSISLLLILSYVFILSHQVLKQADFFIFDLQTKQLAKSLTSDKDIVIITIDDYSLNKMQAISGMWVWPRSIHAQLVEQLNQRPNQAIVFDILFAEEDIYRPDDDAFFNEVVAQNSNIYFAMLQQNTTNEGGIAIEEWANLLTIEKSELAKNNVKARFVLPLAIKQKYWQAGTINFNSDSDGIG